MTQSNKITNNIRIATRKSPLALVQATFVQQQLATHYPQCKIELVPLVTSGDTLLDSNLASLGGKGLFVKELELALLENRADIAVHSMKDLPSIIPQPLEIAAICARTEPRDALLSHHSLQLMDLPHKGTIGTSSLRRQCQLKATRPDLQIKLLRGNIDTRIKKFQQGEFDAIILAAAGLQRLRLEHYITQYFSIDQLLPAAGQGALGIECRQEDVELKNMLQVLADPLTTQCITAERSLMYILEGNCRVPIAAFCECDEIQQLSLRAMVGSSEGDIVLYGHLKGSLQQPEQLGQAVAKALLDQGADMILRLNNE